MNAFSEVAAGSAIDAGQAEPTDNRTLSIVHVLRAPVGGLFRHVRDVAMAQQQAGHLVGVVCDSQTSDRLTEGRLRELEQHLALGLHRLAMSREIGATDVRAVFAARAIIKRVKADIVHGHGAKGGAYARLGVMARGRGAAHVSCFYTPHGGSLHYAPTSLKGRIYMALERALAPLTSGFIFESEFARRTYVERVGAPKVETRVILNGLHEVEFAPHAPAASGAFDFLFLGELRRLKGVDLALDALAEVRRTLPARMLIVGDGPDRQAFVEQAELLGLGDAVRFECAMPARAAFDRARVLVMPSRAESLPYVVLEAAAAGMPLIATDVGGIPEIVQGTDTALVRACDASALSVAMRQACADPEEARRHGQALRDHLARRFTVGHMSAGILGFYRDRHTDLPLPKML